MEAKLSIEGGEEFTVYSMTSTVDILYPKSQAMEVFKKQEEEHPLSYLCNICSNRFVSERALGSHLSAHVPASKAADTLTQTELQKTKRPRTSDDKSMEKDEQEGSDGSGSNLMFAPGRNPNSSWQSADREPSLLASCGFNSKPVDSSINCDLCRKKFSSGRSIKSHCEIHQDSSDAHLEESHKHEIQDQEKDRSESDAENKIDQPSGNSSRFDKGKGSNRPGSAIQLINPREQFGLETNTEEEVAAMCLVMLSSGVNTAQNLQIQAGAKEVGSGNLMLPNTGSQRRKCMRKKPKSKKIDGDAGLYDDDEVKKARYKCTTCSKVFQSHQALGGHISSHKRVMKGCFIQVEDEIISEELNTGSDCQLPGHSQKPPPIERRKDSCVKVRNGTTTIQPAAFSKKKRGSIT